MNELHKAYAVLGLDPGSSMESILRRYKRLIMVWHPDRAPTPEHKEFAEEELKKINNAKDLLAKHFGANGGHKETGCDCQAGAGTTSGARTSSAGGPGPGPNYHRQRTADDKYQEEQEAKRKDAERKAREEAEANARWHQQQQQQQTSKQSMETAMQQQAALRDEKLRWQISIGLIIAFVALEIFGTMAIGAKTWWKDMTWKWQNQSSSSSKPPDTNTNTNTGSTTPYIPPYYQTPGGNQESWQREQAQREQEQRERDQKQHDQDVYFTKLEIDKYEKIIEHCNSELTNLAIKIADPGISEYEKNKLRETRDFRQKNLTEAQDALRLAQEKMTKLTGVVPRPFAPSAVSPITGGGQSPSSIPSNPSPFAAPADPNTLLNPSTNSSIFKRKYGLDGLSTPSTSTPLSDMMKKYADPTPTTPSTRSLFDKKYGGLDSLSNPSSSTSSFSELMKKYKPDQQTPSSTINP